MTELTVDLTPKIVNVQVRRGDQWSYQVTYPTTLVGATISAQLRKRVEDTTFTTLVITRTNDATGIFQVGQTASVEGGQYDVQLTLAGGLPRTIIAGTLTVEADVTR